MFRPSSGLPVWGRAAGARGQSGHADYNGAGFGPADYRGQPGPSDHRGQPGPVDYDGAGSGPAEYDGAGSGVGEYST